jgi:hypothetical protein
MGLLAQWIGLVSSRYKLSDYYMDYYMKDSLWTLRKYSILAGEIVFMFAGCDPVTPSVSPTSERR